MLSHAASAELQECLVSACTGSISLYFCLPNALSMRSRNLSMFRDVQLREVKPGCIASSTCQVSDVWCDDGDALCKQPAVTVSLLPVTSLMLRKDE